MELSLKFLRFWMCTPGGVHQNKWEILYLLSSYLRNNSVGKLYTIISAFFRLVLTGVAFLITPFHLSLLMINVRWFTSIDTILLLTLQEYLCLWLVCHDPLVYVEQMYLFCCHKVLPCIPATLIKIKWATLYL